jgi:tellurite resistance protein
MLPLIHDPLIGKPRKVREAFLAVLHFVLLADGYVDEREQAMLDRIAADLGLEDYASTLGHEAAFDPGWGEQLGHFSEYVLLQCALMAWVDGACPLPERELLEQLETELDAKAGFAKMALLWAEQGYRWMVDGLELLGLDVPELPPTAE